VARNIIDYIAHSHAVCQVVTHFDVIINDTFYCVMGGNSDHRPLCLQLSIDYNFVEPQHTVVKIKNYLGSKMINRKLKSIRLLNNKSWKHVDC
jgi:hypothetical protein